MSKEEKRLSEFVWAAFLWYLAALVISLNGLYVATLDAAPVPQRPATIEVMAERLQNHQERITKLEAKAESNVSSIAAMESRFARLETLAESNNRLLVAVFISLLAIVIGAIVQVILFVTKVVPHMLRASRAEG